MGDDGDVNMLPYHKIEVNKEGSPVVIHCPYIRSENAFGWIDDGGYFKCNGRYCEDAACSYYHECKRDCIIDRIERNEWEEFLMNEFEEDFCRKEGEDAEIEGEDAEIMECYEILKRNNCMISEKTHKHAEMLKRKQQDILDSFSKKIEEQSDEMIVDGKDSKAEEDEYQNQIGILVGIISPTGNRGVKILEALH